MRESSVDRIMEQLWEKGPPGPRAEDAARIKLLAELVRAIDHLSDSFEFHALDVIQALRKEG